MNEQCLGNIARWWEESLLTIKLHQLPGLATLKNSIEFSIKSLISSAVFSSIACWRCCCASDGGCLCWRSKSSGQILSLPGSLPLTSWIFQYTRELRSRPSDDRYPPPRLVDDFFHILKLLALSPLSMIAVCCSLFSCCWWCYRCCPLQVSSSQPVPAFSHCHRRLLFSQQIDRW